MKRKRETEVRSEIVSRGSRSENPRTYKEVKKAKKKKSNRRIVGQKFYSLEGYKDEPYRKSFYTLMQEFKWFCSLSRYKKEATNKKCLRIRSMVIILDPISEYPHVQGNDFDQERDEPCRMIIADDVETTRLLLEDLRINYDKWNVIKEGDPYDIDKRIFGERRPPIENLLGPKKVIKTQDHEANAKMLDDIGTEILISPSRTNTLSFETRETTLT